MKKRKTGLHRKVSSIFDGTSIPKAENAGSGESTDSWTGAAKGREYLEEQTDFMPKVAPVGPKQAVPRPKKVPKPAGGGQTGFDPFGPIPIVSEKRRRVMIVSMVGLFIVLILVLTLTFSRNLASKKAADASKQAAAAATVIPTDVDTQIDWEIPPEYPERLRDPMESTGMHNPATGEWTEQAVVIESADDQQSLIDVGIALRSILWAESGRSIVIADEILYEGDTIFGVTIRKINKDSVEFEKDGVGFLKVFPR
jgi:hypothetical protein